jgi:hypothetical protein
VTDNHHEKLRNNNRAGDRRLKRRYRIEQDVRYKMLYGQRVAETGSGKTTNISSGGVCFTTDSMLSIGIPVELSMNWPVLLNQSCLLKLMIYGCVVRSVGGTQRWGHFGSAARGHNAIDDGSEVPAVSRITQPHGGIVRLHQKSVGAREKAKPTGFGKKETRAGAAFFCARAKGVLRFLPNGS